MNLVLLEGNIGADPEMRATSTGKSVANLRVATTEKYNGTEKTEWHSVVAFGFSADVAREYIKKGTRVAVRGKIQTRKFEDKNGQTRYSTEVIANSIAPIPRVADAGEVTGANTTEKPITDEQVPF